jgi:pyruvate dehydrogenase E1 component alpha subunit
VPNNKYGIGTSTNRSSSNDEYYTMGGKIPGIRVDGMNLLAVRQAMTLLKD